MENRIQTNEPVRMIDANALREVVESHVTSVSVCGTVAEAQGMTRFKGICLEDIDNAPTVEAIPVEWIKAHMTPAMAYFAPRASELLIEAWEKEGKDND